MTMSLAARLWIYQSERFPIKKTGPLLAVFSAASICVSAQLSGRPLPHWSVFLAGFIIAMALFFQLRVCDEYKDLEDDRNFRPERAIPRGLVSLGTIIRLGLLSAVLAGVTAWLRSPGVLLLLILVWVWLGAMTAEFGVPHWLKSHPVLYLLSHMAIMPLIDLLLTSLEWLPHGQPEPLLWMFLALSFVNGCVLEIGRKLWVPENEIDGVETYSGIWGPRRATIVWLACLSLSCALLIGVGFATGVGWFSAFLGLTGIGYCIWCAWDYLTTQSSKSQDRMDTVAGLWVFFCYGTAGFLPYILGVF